MSKRVAGYTFDPVGKTVTFTSDMPSSLADILLIANVTTNVFIYNFADAARGGSYSNGVLTLDYDTSAMSATDSLYIVCNQLVRIKEQEAASVPVDFVTDINMTEVLGSQCIVDNASTSMRVTAVGGQDKQYQGIAAGKNSQFEFPCDGMATAAIQLSYRDWETDRKSTRLNSSHSAKSRMPSSA